jgi:acetyl esterase/lipase
VHGGSFSSGTRTSPELVDESQTFARKGFVNVSIDYRLEPGGCSASTPTSNCITAIQEADADAMTAVRWLRSHSSSYRIDGNRIAIGGSSAGAIVAMNVAYGGNDDTSPAGSEVQAGVSLSGANLLGTIDGHDAPTLLMHGTADPLVPYQWAVNTVHDATAAGDAAYLTTWQGAGHVPYVEHHDEIHDLTTNFLYNEMDLAHAAR